MTPCANPNNYYNYTVIEENKDGEETVFACGVGAFISGMLLWSAMDAHLVYSKTGSIAKASIMSLATIVYGGGALLYPPLVTLTRLSNNTTVEKELQHAYDSGRFIYDSTLCEAYEALPNFYDVM